MMTRELAIDMLHRSAHNGSALLTVSDVIAGMMEDQNIEDFVNQRPLIQDVPFEAPEPEQEIDPAFAEL